MIASLILLMHFVGKLSLTGAITSLCVAGAMLLIAEIAVVSFGLLFLNGAIALYAAFALYMQHTTMLGLEMGWPVLFGIAFVEILVIAIVIAVHMWLKNQKTTTGTEAMIGDSATIIEWNGAQGSVRYDGEIWKAQSEQELELSTDDKVLIDAIEKLHLIIRT